MCEWRTKCQYVASHTVVLGEYGKFGKYCAHHANIIADAVNADHDKATLSSED